MHVLSLIEQERNLRSAFRDKQESGAPSFVRLFSTWLVTILSALVAVHHLFSLAQLVFLWDLILSLC